VIDTFTEIPLTKFGDGGTGQSYFARILRSAAAAPVLQLASTSTIDASVYTLSFRKLFD